MIHLAIAIQEIVTDGSPHLAVESHHQSSQKSFLSSELEANPVQSVHHTPEIGHALRSCRHCGRLQDLQVGSHPVNKMVELQKSLVESALLKASHEHHCGLLAPTFEFGIETRGSAF
jgi:hypothetical protein